MRHSSAAAAVVVAAVVAAPLGASPAAADTRAASREARAAWAPYCEDRSGNGYPCGQWRLIMRDSRTVIVRDALTRAADGDGAPLYGEAPFAVSADGRWIAYVRASDHRMVVRRAAGGPVTELPASLTPKSRGTGDMTLRLSPRGDRLVIDHTTGRRPGTIVTVKTGATVNIPAGEVPQTFSADGDELLTARNLSDNTMVLTVRRLDGGAPVKRRPPQAVAAASVFALAADGRNLAALTPGDYDGAGPPRMREYDLVGDELGPSIKVAVKRGYHPAVAHYRDGDRLAVLAYEDESPAGHAQLIDLETATGAVTQRDHYPVKKNRYTVRLAGA
ncbi:TolB family protein [Nonomuraea typhae]|uniref:TolB family protein n=1 Tax=Nonomuraea typhae TaxID=2603600 RepID=A0ABW7YKK3_9ACTN